jgi:hypothetical protein
MEEKVQMRGAVPASGANDQQVALLTDQACQVGCRPAPWSDRTGSAGSRSGPQRPHHSLGPDPHASGGFGRSVEGERSGGAQGFGPLQPAGNEPR